MNSRQSLLDSKAVNRRDFLKMAGGGIAGGVAVLVIGNKLRWLASSNRAYAAVTSLDFHIGDAIKEMHTHNLIHDARCYFWIYKSAVPDLPPESPGPTIMATVGDTVDISVTNDLDEDHAFYIPGVVDSGPIAPRGTWTSSFTVTAAGAFLYYDNLNEPVNRVMGLHGAFVVLPADAASGHKFTPYDSPTANVQALYDAFGSSDYFPGLAWEEGDPATFTPPFRHYVWILHQASPVLFAEVGNLPAGVDYPANEFMDAFLRDPFSPDPNNSRLAQYFTINGQSGNYAHNSSYVTPMGRVGEPAVVYILNAGLWTHSMHLHANHFYVTSVNGVVQENPIWIDVFTVHPMDRVDYTIPFMRPPDVPNLRGIGRPDEPQTGSKGSPVWPPTEELGVYMPGSGAKIGYRPLRDISGNLVLDSNGRPVRGQEIDLKARQSPLCYPMHDHSEPSQTSQGGNYNTGLISGIYFMGDRNTAGSLDFPLDEDFQMMYGDGADRGCGVTGTHPCAPPSHHHD
ncbi:MAG: multicopper oxidase domain-containing protein [Chloroflexi bacterium]|nr:multicopper oxidase domain-containing protein [Chloroflexota bacterium]